MNLRDTIMGCHLALHVWDRKAELPLDYDVEFGASSLNWPDRVRIAHERGLGPFEWHEAEGREDSVDGVRSWWTDNPDVVLLFLNLVRQEKWGNPDGRIEATIPKWKQEPGRYRFFFELV